MHFPSDIFLESHIMKKSLLALALLGAFTASAFAEPSVTLYGRIDTGLVYTHKNLDNTAGSTDTFSMDSGVTPAPAGV